MGTVAGKRTGYVPGGGPITGGNVPGGAIAAVPAIVGGKFCVAAVLVSAFVAFGTTGPF